MKIPEIEMKALYDWSTAELERIEKEYPPMSGSLDGQYVVEEKKHFNEYNKRLDALKKKYEAEPVTMSRTFNQVRKRAGVV